MNTFSALLENDELVQVILIIVFGGLTFAVLAGLLLMFFPAKNKLEGRMESLGLHSHDSHSLVLKTTNSLLSTLLVSSLMWSSRKARMKRMLRLLA